MQCLFYSVGDLSSEKGMSTDNSMTRKVRGARTDIKHLVHGRDLLAGGGAPVCRGQNDRLHQRGLPAGV